MKPQLQVSQPTTNPRQRHPYSGSYSILLFARVQQPMNCTWSKTTNFSQNGRSWNVAADGIGGSSRTTGRALEKQKVKHYILVFGLGLLKTYTWVCMFADVGNAALDIAMGRSHNWGDHTAAQARSPRVTDSNAALPLIKFLINFWACLLIYTIKNYSAAACISAPWITINPDINVLFEHLQKCFL